MKGNFHVQFLGEGVAATSPPYPTPGWATTQVYPARVSGGDLGWGDPKSFTLGLLEEVVRDTQRVAAQIAGPGAPRRRACW